MSMQEEIQTVIDKFHKKMEDNPDMKKEIEPITKTFNIDLGSECYSMRIKDAQVTDFVPSMLDEADVTLITSPENLHGLIEGTLRPMKAYVLKKVQIKGKIDDLLFLKKFF